MGGAAETHYPRVRLAAHHLYHNPSALSHSYDRINPGSLAKAGASAKEREPAPSDSWQASGQEPMQPLQRLPGQAERDEKPQRRLQRQSSDIVLVDADG